MYIHIHIYTYGYQLLLSSCRCGRAFSTVRRSVAAAAEKAHTYTYIYLHVHIYVWLQYPCCLLAGADVLGRLFAEVSQPQRRKHLEALADELDEDEWNWMLKSRAERRRT